MTPHHRWFLPETPDVLGLLREQADVTIAGLEAFEAWSRGDAPSAERVRALEHDADACKHRLREGLTQAFAPPMDPEDAFALSQGIDDVLDHAKNTVREAEVMGTAPDAPMAAMGAALLAGARDLADAFAALGSEAHAARATAAADRAIQAQREVEHVYRAAMSALIDSTDLGEVTARRELYRRLCRTGDQLVVVAERVWYAVLKLT